MVKKTLDRPTVEESSLIYLLSVFMTTMTGFKKQKPKRIYPTTESFRDLRRSAFFSVSIFLSTLSSIRFISALNSEVS